jgi:hypothetical protein
MLKFKGMTKFHVDGGGMFGSSIIRVVTHSEVYLHEYKYENERKGFVDGSELIDRTLDRLFWYLWVANKTACAINYKEEPDFFGDIDENKEEPIVACSIRELYDGLGLLDYN